MRTHGGGQRAAGQEHRNRPEVRSQSHPMCFGRLVKIGKTGGLVKMATKTLHVDNGEKARCRISTLVPIGFLDRAIFWVSSAGKLGVLAPVQLHPVSDGLIVSA